MSRWKQGDTKPDMVVTCFDAAREPANLTGASEVRVIVTKRGVPAWERVVTGDAQGKVTVPLQASDTAQVGTYSVKVRVTWPDAKHQHYPPADRWLTFTVTR